MTEEAHQEIICPSRDMGYFCKIKILDPSGWGKKVALLLKRLSMRSALMDGIVESDV